MDTLSLNFKRELEIDLEFYILLVLGKQNC